MFSTAVVSILIRSEGCDDPGKTLGTCGVAYIFVNGKNHSPANRGHNVVIVDAKTGKQLLQLYMQVLYDRFLPATKQKLHSIPTAP